MMKTRHLTTALATIVAGAAAATATPPLAVPTGPNDGQVKRLHPSELDDLAATLGLPPTMLGGGGASVTLETDFPLCSTTVEVRIDLADAPSPVGGGQFFLSYDTSALTFVSADPASSIYTLEVSETVDAMAGEIDYAVGVGLGDPPSAADATMAVLTFTATGDLCWEDGLVTFRSDGGGSGNALTDGSGTEVPATFDDLGFVIVDTTAPMVTAPADISVKADPGGCDWTPTLLETFDAAVDACDTGCAWITDRYPSAVFEQDAATFSPDFVLNQGVDVADSEANRPPSFSSPFYNWQGYKRSVNIPQGASFAADVWIPASWDGAERVASLWGQNTDAAGFISGFPVLAFNGAVDEMGTPTPRFRAFVQDTDGDDSNGFQPGWVDMLDVTGFDRWYRFEIELTQGLAPDFVFTVTDLSTDTVVASYTDSGTFDSVAFTDVFLQLYNFGATYETWWDDVTVGPDGPVVADCIANTSYERSDDPMLTLADPFPSGTTTVSWTVEDACGQTTVVDQLVTVDPVNQFSFQVQLEAGPATLSLPFTRCLTFEFGEAGCGAVETVDAEVTFIDGGGGLTVGFGSIDIPCGDYDCVRVRDGLHTLANVDANDFVIVPGVAYTAGWDDAGERLVSGNLNDDGFIDILDFGVFIGDFGTVYADGNTDCATAFPHADVDGSGVVDALDFSFISGNFLELAAAPCCAAPATGGGDTVVRDGRRPDPRDPRATAGEGPLVRISIDELRRRGLGHLEVADLNDDGWVDVLDIAAFYDGARP